MTFGAVRVVQGLQLDIARGEFVSMLGPSGSGKTTILMMLAGFLTPTAGRIFVDGQRIDRLPPYRRDMGVVFQNYALFPHMTVAENVAFPLKQRRVGRAETTERVRRALDMVQLSHTAERRPTMLSGGQQQRIALARALVFEPSVVLMDEPLGALDKQLREQMQLDIRELHRRLGLTIVFVTHDQGEALTMSDRIAVFNQGRIDQIGAPDEIYDRPATRFVAEFIGETNLLPGKVTRVADGLMQVALEGGPVIAVAADGHAAGDAVLVSLRPERLRIPSGPVAGAENLWPVDVEDCVYQGDHIRLHLRHGALRLIARIDRSQPVPEIGHRAQVHFAAADCWIVKP
ncbi:ABC transporter ATP-binding protein [Paenirhodobacter sp.]|uniref:ABC transporter ATP-binding protein n=1 Tax=Paenirhodobacter sp. TaxID=1965326 RepID=UPI003B405FF9